MSTSAIGFDLGTTLSVASVIGRDGRPTVVRDAYGQHLIPSAIYFDTNVVVGESALQMGLMDPDGLAEAFKRDIGKPHFSREIRGYKVPPEILTAMLIRQLAANARAAIGEFAEAVITVPAYFDEKKRTATQQAAQLAGVSVLDIINEPTAAAIAAGREMLLEQPANGRPRRMLVYDLGGGTFDVTILEFDRRTFRALATDGDIHLGGRDFDERILHIIADRFAARHGVDPRSQPRELQQLWRLARDVKHHLSRNERAPVYFEANGLKLEFELTRAEFEAAIEALIERSLATTRDVVEEAKIAWNEIDDFLLVGGSSRIPMVAQKAEALWGRPPRLVSNPDELIAHGAALYAAAKSGAGLLDEHSRFDIVNVNAHSLGIQGRDMATNQEINQILIPRNTPLPAAKTRSFVTHIDGQKSVRARLLEGESQNPRFCTQLADCVVNIDPPLPKGASVQVTCNYLANGTISVSAKMLHSKSSAHVEIRRDGYSMLDPLEVWQARLTSGADIRSTDVLSKRSGRPAAATAADLTAKRECVRRLDEIYQYIGKLSAATTPPAGAVQTHRLVGLLENEAATLRQLVESLEVRHSKAEDLTTRFEIAPKLAQIKMAWEQSMRLLDHARLALGRECVAERFVPSEAAPFVSEAIQLQARIDD